MNAFFNRLFRDAIGAAFVLSVLVSWWLDFLGHPAVAAESFVTAFVHTAFALFVLAGAYVVFGRRLFDRALEAYKTLFGAGESE